MAQQDRQPGETRTYTLMQAGGMLGLRNSIRTALDALDLRWTEHKGLIYSSFAAHGSEARIDEFAAWWDRFRRANF